MILIPVKNLANAKQRLASVLNQATRTELARAMLQDVLETVARAASSSDVSLVTGDAFALALASQFAFQIIPDDANRSETDAIQRATEFCEAKGIRDTLVIPADVPLIQASELEAIFRAAPTEGSVLVPAADGRGTNAIFRCPPALFPLRFGNDSFKPHLAAAQAVQKPCVILSLAGIALDIDNPADLLRLAALPGETRAQKLVRQWKVAAAPLAVNE
jgi:2-phospho-L-lactate/phosphoenolpyruvate guanylyltransferase